jgi:antitoxin component YwqK of YwqJK toxin-antitoxin module
MFMSTPIDSVATTFARSLTTALFVVILLPLSSCEKFSSSKRSAADDSLAMTVPGDPQNTNIRRTYYPDGKIHKEIVTNNGTKSGISKEYYKNGKVFQEVNYVANLREGIARRYFDTGVLSQETPYKNDKMHGVQKKYRRSGKLMAEVPYFEGHRCIGLKEFTTEGVVKVRYPTIEITPINTILKDGNFILEVRMSDDSKGVEYYTGELVDGKYIKEEMNTVFDKKDGVARIYYSVPKGDFRMEKVNVIAKVKTAQSNYYITQKSYHLAVENR